MLAAGACEGRRDRCAREAEIVEVDGESRGCLEGEARGRSGRQRTAFRSIEPGRGDRRVGRRLRDLEGIIDRGGGIADRARGNTDR